MVISSDFRMEQNRDDDHREDAPRFTISKETLESDDICDHSGAVFQNCAVIVTVITLCEVKKEPVDQKKSI